MRLGQANLAMCWPYAQTDMGKEFVVVIELTIYLNHSVQYERDIDSVI